MGDSLVFLSVFRLGMSTFNAVSQNGRLLITPPVKLVDENNIDQGYTSLPFGLRGPGEVTGFNPRIIARTEPVHNCSNFEPNYFPFVELSEPDFPWRYSVEASGAGISGVGRITPWIALISLKKSEITASSSGGVKLPTITVKQNILPDLKFSWAWAHAQISKHMESSPEDVQAFQTEARTFIEQNPGMVCSRLLSPRRLDPFTSYSAFIVPVYDIGVKAGRGEPVTQSDTLAWDCTSTEDIELPVYYQWDFQTGESGDFEALIERLKFRPPPDNFGTKEVDGSRPGMLNGSDMEYLEETFSVEGALAELKFSDKRGQLLKSDFVDALRNELNEVISTDRSSIVTDHGGRVDKSNFLNVDLISTLLDKRIVFQDKIDEQKVYFDETIKNEDQLTRRLNKAGVSDREPILRIWRQINYDPLVSLPVYGIYYKEKPGQQFDSPPETPVKSNNLDWKSELNLDARNRVAASLGVSVVRDNQDKFMKECWEQAGAIGEANELLRFSASSVLSGTSMEQRHLDPLGDYHFALLTRPDHGKLIYKDAGRETTFKTSFTDCGLPKGLFSYGARRAIAAAVPGLPLPKDIFRFLANQDKKDNPDPDEDISFVFQLFYQNPEPPSGMGQWKPKFYPLPIETYGMKRVDIQGKLRPLVRTHKVIMEKMQEIISIPIWTGSFWSVRPVVNLDPLMRAPEIKRPMYRYLKERSVELLAPGLGGLVQNSVVLLAENRKFIEAFMCGLNHEMANELFWRGYPTDRRGTVFKYFWEPAVNPNQPGDIQEIERWGKELGQNAGGLAMSDVVLTIKADLIRRYPDMIVFAVKTAEIDPQKWDWNGIYDSIAKDTPASGSTVYKPLFNAIIGNDQIFMGFEFSAEDVKKSNEYYFVLMQQPSLPRFGLDCTHAAGDTGWDSLSWEDGVLYTNNSNNPGASYWVGPDKLDQAGENFKPLNPPHAIDAGSIAAATFQKPVRLIVPASIFLAEVSK